MTVYDFTVQCADGSEKSLKEFEGQVLLIVNTASKCGHTPQYEGLQRLQEQYGDLGFTVLGFPCNQFGEQEPGSNEDIQEFCRVNYQVNFPVFGKIDVNGEYAHPLYQYLRKVTPEMNEAPIAWNFAKFLIDGSGRSVRHYPSKVQPSDIAGDIESLVRS